MTDPDRRPVVDLTDDEARAALVLKWGDVETGVIPAWVAEMDYAVAEPIVAAVRAARRPRRAGLPGLRLRRRPR